ncbi:penicillin acylase family protein [Algoriphagus hitonicola]|uniref:Penicillin amidase n=1 Tax=Algoriphagus hitonicola TaxID=435880 RepID=A0A1I2X570_9BACT|nr:penicillin acylase family protein [Algoriphagus hitonicola]SFH08665.1 penicillin amidase [Algoriphagus hitonicola]
MKYFSFFAVSFIAIGLGYLSAIQMGPVPPLGLLLDPSHGFWQNSYSEDDLAREEIEIEGLSAPVSIRYDENLIPHIFAENELDLYRAQGYVTAQHRLWQMEFQTMAAAGRISELVGEVALELDRMTRRKGLGYGSEMGMKFLIENDPETLSYLEAYAEGVNEYIESLDQASLPLEYKILNYRPEPWTPSKSLLLLKYMTDMLVGDRDLEYTNLRKILGDELLNKLFPEYPEEVYPVIESGKVWGFEPLTVEKPDSIRYPDDELLLDPLPQPEEGIGSNNWAVSGSKTKSGNPILANDPHLGLNLPSIWYSMQLSTPAYTVKGASLPGALGIISGFNEWIAWGVTNATKDARDWYKVTFKDQSRSAYRYGDEWRDAEVRLEEIKIKGEKKPFVDTVIYTHYGPVVYDRSFRGDRQDTNFALKWTLHQGSNEQKTFLLLNQSKNHGDYLDALDHYVAPAQNFAFASQEGDIAMRIQGKFPLKWEGQGKFFMNGEDPAMEWEAYIPNDHNPATLNPERGFVSSANQHPVDSLYPYYVFDHTYEHYRNRRIIAELESMDQITMEDMMKLQFDDYYLHASEALPVMLDLLGENYEKSEQAEKYLSELREWDFYADPNQKAPSLFITWWNKTYVELWKNLSNSKSPIVLPNNYQTSKLILREPEFELFDHKETPQVESAADHVKKGFEEMVNQMRKWESEEGDYSWANYKQTTINHLVPQFESFSVKNIYTGGGRGIVNATSKGHGASWRMIVELGEEVKAIGIYPGGQSGNPGSRFYQNFIPKWANGEYLNFDLRSEGDLDSVLFTTQLTPSK